MAFGDMELVGPTGGMLTGKLVLGIGLGAGVGMLVGHTVQHIDDCACDPEKNAHIARSRVTANIVAALRLITDTDSLQNGTRSAQFIVMRFQGSLTHTHCSPRA